MVVKEEKDILILSLGDRASTQTTKLEEFCSVPQPATISLKPLDLSNGLWNYTSLLHSTVVQLFADCPDRLLMRNNMAFPVICPTTMVNYLHWLCESVLRKRGLVSSDNVYDPAFGNANEELLIPNGLAKMLEYMMPYTDGSSFITLRNTYSMPVFAPGASKKTAVSMASTDSWVCTVVNSNFQICVMSADKLAISKEHYVTDYVMTGACDLASYVANAGFFNTFLAGFSRGMTPIKSIPYYAPDASFYAYLDFNTTSYCYTPNFDIEMVNIWSYPSDAKSTTSYSRPYCKTGPLLRTLGQYDASGYRQSSVDDDLPDHFVHLCSRSPYIKGKMYKMLEKCEYGPVKSMQRVVFYNDCSALRAILMHIVEVYDITTVDYYLLDMVANCALLAKTNSYNWISQCSDDSGAAYSNTMIFCDLTYISAMVHPLIGAYIGRIGPVLLPTGMLAYPRFASAGNGAADKPNFYQRTLYLNAGTGLARGQTFYPCVRDIYTIGPAPAGICGFTPSASDGAWYGVTPYAATGTILVNHNKVMRYYGLDKIAVGIPDTILGHLSTFMVAVGSLEVGVDDFTGYDYAQLRTIGNLLIPTDIGLLRQGIYFYGACSWYYNLEAGMQDTIQKINIGANSGHCKTMIEFMKGEPFAKALSTAGGNFAAKGQKTNWWQIVNELIAAKMDGGGQFDTLGNDNFWHMAKSWTSARWCSELDRNNRPLSIEELNVEGPKYIQRFKDRLVKPTHTGCCSMLNDMACCSNGFIKKQVKEGNVPTLGKKNQKFTF